MQTNKTKEYKEYVKVYFMDSLFMLHSFMLCIHESELDNMCYASIHHKIILKQYTPYSKMAANKLFLCLHVN